MFGLVIDNQSDPYLVTQEHRDSLDELIKMNEADGHQVTVVELDRECVICTDIVEGWTGVDEQPIHAGVCYAEYDAWHRADYLDYEGDDDR